jgi:DNA-binding transcriptional LysR family regulator
MPEYGHIWCRMAPIDVARRARSAAAPALPYVRTFVALYEAGSFSAAAARLGVPRSTVSRHLAALEETLGVVLFDRDTRNVVTTSEGRDLYDRAGPALANLETALADRPARVEDPNGTLRLTTTADIATIVLGEVISRFVARHPGVNVELHLTDQIVDLVRDGFDVAIRVATGRLRGPRLVARKLGDVAVALYAAPSFLARHGQPRTPEELRGLDWVGFRGGPALELGFGGAHVAMNARARIVCNDMFFLREALRRGAGIGALPSFVADPDVAEGALARVFSRFVAHTGTIHFVHPERRHLPARVTAFRELLLELLRQRPIGG